MSVTNEQNTNDNYGYIRIGKDYYLVADMNNFTEVWGLCCSGCCLDTPKSFPCLVWFDKTNTGTEVQYNCTWVASDSIPQYFKDACLEPNPKLYWLIMGSEYNIKRLDELLSITSEFLKTHSPKWKDNV